MSPGIRWPLRKRLRNREEKRGQRRNPWRLLFRLLSQGEEERKQKKRGWEGKEMKASAHLSSLTLLPGLHGEEEGMRKRGKGALRSLCEFEKTEERGGREGEAGDVFFLSS